MLGPFRLHRSGGIECSIRERCVLLYVVYILACLMLYHHMIQSRMASGSYVLYSLAFLSSFDLFVVFMIE